MLAVSQSAICGLLCALGPSPGDGFLLHVWFTGCCSSSPPYSVSFMNQFISWCFFYHLCMYCILNAMMLSDVILKVKLRYLMVSSVVGFYSSPFFTGILPRAKDTNLTQVPDTYQSPASCSPQTIRADVILCFISDHCKQCVSAHPQLSIASLFTHNW